MRGVTMNPRVLVRPLEAAWQGVLDEVLAARKDGSAPSTGDIARLGPRLKELSRAYNAGEAEGRRTKLPIDARIAFSFPRDVPKGAGAVRELVASGLLAPRDRPLRVLDLGAGLGAMTWGLVRALIASGAGGGGETPGGETPGSSPPRTREVDALLVDEDPAILQAAEAIARAATKLATPVTLRVRTETRSIASFVAKQPADVVFLGQVLSEMAPGADPEVRVAEHVTILRRLLDTATAADGALVVVEPALRERTRHLQSVRDRLAAEGVTVFAPCLHARPCPTLLVPDAWCHEDLAVDLPSWVVPLARAAGLRWQGLTFSYLVLRRDGNTMSAAAPYRFRAVSELLRSKGKAELFVCTEQGNRERIRRLERDDGKEHGVLFETLRRGDVVGLRADDPAQSPVDERGRLNAQLTIDVGHLRQ